MLKLLEFIKTHPDWEERLSMPPYCIITKRKDGYVLFKYTQRGLDYTSDFNLEIVRECRGIILNESDNYKPVCVPFFKFGNYGEPYADEIDWQSAQVVEKIDGSLIKVWYDSNHWRVSTSGNINAYDAVAGSGGVSFGDVFEEAKQQSGLCFNHLDPSFTYMFELISPRTQVVIPHKETKLYHIGTRNNSTLQEADINIGVEKPKTYDISSIESILESAKTLDQYTEGFIVADKFYRRIKVKSPLYVKLHYTLGNCTTDRNIIDIIRSGEMDEVLAYFPEHASVFASMQRKLDKFIADNERELETISTTSYATRKELADYDTKTPCPACIFGVLDGKSPSVKEFIMNMPVDSLDKYLKNL